MSHTAQQDVNQSRTLLEETFYVLTKKSSVFRVKLTNDALSLIKETENEVKTQVISIKNIIGCRSLRSKKQGDSCACQSLYSSALKVVDEKSGEHDSTDVSAYLYIYAYILQSNRGKRERITITLRFRSFDKYEDNFKEAQRWRFVLKKLLLGEEISLMPIMEYRQVSTVKENRRLLILLSPKSGCGKSRLLFQKKVVPILQEAEVPYDLHVTKHANYAREFVRTCNLFQWSGILAVGGDGIVFEVINGIFERWDWSEVLKHIAIGVVPGGSGNGLARSIAYNCSEPYVSPVITSALTAVGNHTEPMDLVRIETTSDIMFSFLSIGWGLLSDIDIESEHFRMLGGQRFALWSVARLIGLRCYGGKVYYLPSEPALSTERQTRQAWDVGDKCQLPAEIELETHGARQRLDSWYSTTSRRSNYFSATGSSYQSTAESSNSLDKPRQFGPASGLPCLTSPLPPNWKCISGRFIMVHASYQTHLGGDCLFAPNAKLNDGLIWLLIIHAEASRAQVLQFLLGLGTGAHATTEWSNGVIEFIPVRGLRIEPDLDVQGYMTVDGEQVKYGPIQAEVFPALARVMVP